MRLITASILLTVVLWTVQTTGYTIDGADKISSKCQVADLKIEPQKKNIVCNEESQSVNHGSTCNVSTDVGDYTQVDKVICVYGHWTKTDAIEDRHKRCFWCGVAAGVITIIVICYFFCKQSSDGSTTVYYPPKFLDNCKPTDLPAVIIVPSGRTSVQVTWTEPTVTDEDTSPNDIVIKQISTPRRGDTFEGSIYDTGYRHNVVYEAEDPQGLRDTCIFSFYVKVLTCDAPRYLSNGERTCSHGVAFIRGSTCRHSCNDGYELSGPEFTTCQGENSPTWSDTTRCQPITCGKPADLANGKVSCYDTGYYYSSICTFHCDTGYRLVGDTFIRCSADRSWTQADFFCEDDTPPSLSCVTPQLFYADAKATSTVVTWTLPTAIDTIDADPVVTKLEGPEFGAVISGTSYVTYTAVDDAGNRAQICIIELRVQQIRCNHPLDAFKDPHIRFTCDENSYAYGTECEASCILNLPLAGTNLVTCEKRFTSAGSPEGYWGWGSGDKPYCEQISCPALDPPVNGALVYDTVHLRPVYTMLCNRNYTITSNLESDGTTVTFNGQFTCTDSGTWLPIDYAPDCTVRRRPGSIGLLSEMLYYSGDCTSESTQAEIIAIFQEILANVTEFYQTLCPSGQSCAATEPKIVCGPLSTKRKREAQGSDTDFYNLSKRQATGSFYTLLKFVIDVTWNPPIEMSIDDAFFYYDDIHAALKTATQTKVTEGWFLMDNAPISMTQAEDPFTTEVYGNLICEEGYRLSGIYCNPCPTGHFLNGSACSRCPVGSFSASEGATTCTPCAPGFSTKDIGANSSSQCIPLCLPGTFSPDGLEVCSACRLSTYQTGSGQTFCTQCPANTYTKTDGSTSADQCLDYDVYIESSQGTLTLYELVDVTSDFSLVLWIKSLTSLPMVTIQLSSNNTTVLSMTISDDIVLNIRGNAALANSTFDSNIWNHLALLLDFTNNTASAFINGNRVIVQSAAFSTDALSSLSGEQGRLTLSNTGFSGIFVSGLRIQSNILNLDGFQSQTNSCHVTTENGVVGMDVFKSQSLPGVTIIAPSACDAKNECASMPCGSHICINEIGGYSCLCFRGFTGTNCETRPDYCLGNECQNGSTCVPEDDGYNCSCVLGYTGEFCEFKPIDGEWSEWSSWTVCNQTCDGKLTRSRSCDNPAPGPGGTECTGEQIESEPCNVACPTCPSLNRLSGTRKQCSTDTETGNQVCTVSCLDGYQFPPGLNGSQEIYKCGRGTGYEWTPKQTTLACVTGYPPRQYSLSTAIQYEQEIPSSDSTEISDVVESRLAGTPCFNMLACSAAVDVASSRKRSTGSTLTINFTISLTDSGDLDLSSFSQNGTVSTSLQEVIDAINNLENTATYVETNINTLFDVTVSGVSYTVDSTSLQVQAIIDCTNGQTASSGICVACPEGTYLNGSVCELCEKGTYQTSPGQTNCIKCPFGYTTSSIGSAFSTQCSVQDGFSATPETAPKSEKDVTAIAIGISSAALVLLFAAVGLIIYLKKRGRQNKRVSSEVNLKSHTIIPSKPQFKSTDFNRPSTALSLSRDVNLIFHSPTYEEDDYQQ